MSFIPFLKTKTGECLNYFLFVKTAGQRKYERNCKEAYNKGIDLPETDLNKESKKKVPCTYILKAARLNNDGKLDFTLTHFRRI